MIERLVATRLILPGVLAVFGVVFLVLLGNWQWQRLQWKEGLIAKLEATAQADPVPLQKALEAGDDIDELRFKRVVVRGQYDHSSEMHVWTPGDGGAGWSVLTLMVLDTPVSIRAGGANDRIIVDRGRVPDAAKEPKTRSEGQVDGMVEIVGRIRKFADPGIFGSPPKPENNEWYDREFEGFQRNLSELGAGENRGAGLTGSGKPLPNPGFYIQAETAASGAGAPQPVLSKLTLSNRHLAYAFTWWGLAFTLAAVYLVFAYGRLSAQAKRAAEQKPA